MKRGVLEQQIIKVLESDPQSRNSDIRLTQLVWGRFYNDLLTVIEGETYVDLNSLFELPREDNIKRIRAKIQNVTKKYLPTDPAVAQKRGWEEQEWREYLGYQSGDTL